MNHSLLSFSKGRSSSVSGRSLAAANMLGSAVCLLSVERNEQRMVPVRTRVTRTSFASNVGSSFGGLIFGIILFPGWSIGIIACNKFRDVRKWKSLVEVEHKCRKISCSRWHGGLEFLYQGQSSAHPTFGMSVCLHTRYGIPSFALRRICNPMTLETFCISLAINYVIERISLFYGLPLLKQNDGLPQHA